VAGLRPDVDTRRAATARVAVAVAEQATAEGVADPLDDPVQAVQDTMWHAVYSPLDVSSGAFADQEGSR
jgi:malate dehydrogenase (oxaloacetate-decarboxylating)